MLKLKDIDIGATFTKKGSSYNNMVFMKTNCLQQADYKTGYVVTQCFCVELNSGVMYYFNLEDECNFLVAENKQ